jgi:hypothetical protein
VIGDQPVNVHHRGKMRSQFDRDSAMVGIPHSGLGQAQVFVAKSPQMPSLARIYARELAEADHSSQLSETESDTC